MPRTRYITTPIYYVNDRPHIGHCYTSLVADVAARAHRLIGDDVFFLTGTDEHADKVVKAAAERGLDTMDWATRNAERFKRAFAFMEFSNDDFVRTTEERHWSRAKAYIQKLVDNGDITLGDYEGWYDPSQEEYVTETNAKEHGYTSPVTGRALERRTEQNWFFDLPKYAGWLREQIASDSIRVLPEARKNEMLSRIDQGLNPVPVSRRLREDDADWGVRMPNDPEHRVYVWIEALCNYLTMVDTDARRKFWPPPEGVDDAPASIVHLMAKDILWFHAVIWPAMLHALGERPPEVIYAHAYWIAEGRKMSKSLGNFIEIENMEAYAQRYSVDALRWFLTTRGPLGATDADFAHGRFLEVYNADLANGIGNAASRVSNMIGKYFDGKVPDADGRTEPISTSGDRGGWPDIAKAEELGAVQDVHRIALDEAAQRGVALVSDVDRYINETRPFSLAKDLDGERVFETLSNREALETVLYHCAETLRIASLLLYPAMPRKMADLWRRWGCEHLRDPEDPDSAFRAPLADLAEWGGPYGLKPGQRIEKGEALFMRADPAEGAPEPGPAG